MELMQILQVSISNFLGLKKVEITPDSKMNIFAGVNAQGKSDVIEALKFAFKGSSDEDIINFDADKASVLIDLGKYKIARSKTRKSDKLTVETADGDVKKSPQSFLDAIVGNAFAFDPMEMLTLKEKDFRQYLMKLFPAKVTPEMLQGKIDDNILESRQAEEGFFDQDGFAVLKDLQRYYYDRRTDKNKDVTQKKALYDSKKKSCEGFDVASYHEGEEASAEETVAKFQEMLTQAQAMMDSAENTKALREKFEWTIDARTKELAQYKPEGFKQIESLESERSAIVLQIDELTAKYEALGVKLEPLHTERDDYNTCLSELSSAQADLAALTCVETIPDIPMLTAKVEGARQRLTTAREMERLHGIWIDAEQGIKADYLALKEESDRMTTIINFLKDELPLKLAETANIPIPGLWFDGDKVMIGKKALKYMSTKEKVGVALGVAREMSKNSYLKLLCIDRAESLDDATLAELRTQAENDEFVYFMTYVQHGDNIPENAYLVQNGEITKGGAI